MNLQNREKGKSETEKNSDGEVAGGDKKTGRIVHGVEKVWGYYTKSKSNRSIFFAKHKLGIHTNTHTQTSAQLPDPGMSDLADAHSRRH